MLLRALNLLYSVVQMTKICKFNGIRNIHNKLDYHQILRRPLFDHNFTSIRSRC